MRSALKPFLIAVLLAVAPTRVQGRLASIIRRIWPGFGSA